jgi:hypothetical protein
MNKRINKRNTRIWALAALAVAAATWGAWLATDLRAQDRDWRRGDRERSSWGRDSRDLGRYSESRAPEQPSTRPAREQSYEERYLVLAQRNIFLRDRSRLVPPPPRFPSTGPSTTESRRPEMSFVLTGLALQEGRHVAFLENLRTGATERVVQGTSIALGRIVRVEVDFLEYEADGRRTRVEIGRNLTGQVASSYTGPVTLPSSPSTQPGAGAPSGAGVAALSPDMDINDPNLTPEQRLKLRRLKEEAARQRR